MLQIIMQGELEIQRYLEEQKLPVLVWRRLWFVIQVQKHQHYTNHSNAVKAKKSVVKLSFIELQSWKKHVAAKQHYNSLWLMQTMSTV